MAEEPNPTRMELLKIKERIALARKGHKLLKQKRDALILEFFKILKKSEDLRGELNKKMEEAYSALAIAETYHSVFELESIALACKRDISLDVDINNVMGVKIPSITSQLEREPIVKRNYSISGTSGKIDNVVLSFEDALLMVVKLAETETAIRKLILEIEKTKRRVNALEFILLPRLEKQKKNIMFKLDEMERDSFVSLKSIKRKLEKKG